jgi:hypothetical protein
MMLADLLVVRSWSITELCIVIVMIAAVIALMFVALNKFGVAIPDWVKQCFWIVVVAFMVIFAIRLVASM